MNSPKFLLAVTISFGLLTSCVRKKAADVSPQASESISAPAVARPAAAPSAKPLSPQERTSNLFQRLMEQADSIHREAWWVLTNERRPLGKSPFGKVQRALLSQQTAKLANKSLFRCDRYEVKRDMMSTSGYPQKIEMYEKCSVKSPAKHMAMISAMKEGELDLVLYPEGLEEVLGIGAAIINKTITCNIRTNAEGQLLSLKCKDWAQEKNHEQMIRLDVYDYQKEGQNMIKLRGKIYENLSDIRKIEADVPMTGKIVVTETELYAPTPTPTPKPSPTPTPTPTPVKSPVAEGEEQQPTEGQEAVPTPTSPPVMLPGGVIAAPPPPPDAEPATGTNPAADQGWPTDENGNIIENPQPLEPDGSQQGQPQQQHQAPEHPGVLNDQGVPSGR